MALQHTPMLQSLTCKRHCKSRCNTLANDAETHYKTTLQLALDAATNYQTTLQHTIK